MGHSEDCLAKAHMSNVTATLFASTREARRDVGAIERWLFWSESVRAPLGDTKVSQLVEHNARENTIFVPARSFAFPSHDIELWILKQGWGHNVTDLPCVLGFELCCTTFGHICQTSSMTVLWSEHLPSSLVSKQVWSITPSTLWWLWKRGVWIGCQFWWSHHCYCRVRVCHCVAPVVWRLQILTVGKPSK